MDVNSNETIIIDSDHSIEFGQASWDDSVESIRRRKNTNGKYDPFSSSEIPINEGFLDIARLFIECLKRDKISLPEMVEVQNEIAQSISRMQNP